MNTTHLAEKHREELLSQQIFSLYRERLNHELGEINFHWFEDKLMIVLEETVTQPEKLLYQNNCQKLADRARNIIDESILPDIKIAIEQIMNVSVVDLLSDTTINTSRTGIIAIFTLQLPQPIL
jgi:uncharacterized protein YbcI